MPGPQKPFNPAFSNMGNKYPNSRSNPNERFSDAREEQTEKIVFYNDKEKKELSTILFDKDKDSIKSKAEKEAELLVRANLNSNQLRKFYHEAKRLENELKRVENEIKGSKIEVDPIEKSWNIIKPLVKMLKSKAAYASRKSGMQKIPMQFKDFIVRCVDSIDDRRDFEGFLKYFEAVVGYFYEGGR